MVEEIKLNGNIEYRIYRSKYNKFIKLYELLISTDKDYFKAQEKYEIEYKYVLDNHKYWDSNIIKNPIYSVKLVQYNKKTKQKQIIKYVEMY